MGVITEDRETAVSGLLGKRAAMAPFEIRVGANVYHMGMIEDRVMTPLVAQMAVFSTIDATQRAVGPAAYTVRGRMDFDGGSVRLDSVYSGDVGVAALAAMGVSTPLGAALSSGFGALKLKGISLEVGTVDRRSQLQIAEAVAPRQVHPGGQVNLAVTLAGDNGAEVEKAVRYRVPVGAPPGPLYFTVSDATSTNFLDLQAAMGTPLRKASQLLGQLNAQRSNTKAYVRVWRAENAYSIQGRDLPDPPPSLAMILARAQIGGAAAAMNLRGSKVAEIEIPAGDFVVTGSKTVQVEVKE
jgi:hypothetical protein